MPRFATREEYFSWKASLQTTLPAVPPAGAAQAPPSTPVPAIGPADRAQDADENKPQP